MNIFLSIGSNIGKRESNLYRACMYIESHIGAILRASSIYETSAWGFVSADFLNQVVQVYTHLPAQDVLERTKKIEKCMGRTYRKTQQPYSARIIDIDILLYGCQKINTPQLVVPHPYMTLRNFVLEPLAEIAPEVKHPLTGKIIRILLRESTDKQLVKKTEIPIFSEVSALL